MIHIEEPKHPKLEAAGYRVFVTALACLAPFVLVAATVYRLAKRTKNPLDS
jgi:hypothetical protein